MANEKKRSGEASGKAGDSNKRRKQNGVQKFYAVRAGKKPGVYMNYADCEAQIAGHKGAQFKSFLSRQDAEQWVAGKRVVSTDEPEKFYAVAVGRETGIFLDYADVIPLITGFKGQKQKKFDTKAGAVEYILQYGSAEAIEGLKRDGYIEDDSQAEESESEEVLEDEDDEDDEDDLLAEQLLVETPPAPVEAKVKVQSTAQAGIRPGSGPGAKPWHVIYTDGSSRNNGKAGARAGYGVYFGQGDSRNIAERLPGPTQTNQRAELMAILRALEVMPLDQNVEIYTDSQYSLNAVSIWAEKWEKNDWKTSKGEPVVHRDIIEAVRTRIQKRARLGTKTAFQWVKGHADSEGNNAADQLACKGATLSLPSERA